MNDNQKYGVDSPEYANAYQTYVLRGHKYLSDAELRVLNIGTEVVRDPVKLAEAKQTAQDDHEREVAIFTRLGLSEAGSKAAVAGRVQ